MIKKCVVCKRDFEAWSEKSCSKECRVIHNRERNRKMRIHKVETFNCVRCNKEVTRFRKRGGFCSRPCASKKYYDDGTYNNWKKFVSPKKTPEEQVLHKLRKNASRNIKFYLKKQLIPKTEVTWKKLPYTPKELKEHLENQFDTNMSWDNYGTYWTIDHIIPQSKLLFTTLNDDNFIKCWSLSNLRPLEKIANIKKSNKLIGE